MNEPTTDLEKALALARKLSPVDSVHLIGQVATTLEKELAEPEPQPRRSLPGVLARYGTAPSAEEIDEARREMWGNFPH
jgi:hypothetical protein